MAGLLESVDMRTNLVGENRLELLLFHLQSHHFFAINVFKVKEVVKLPALNVIPNAHENIEGVANIRGTSIPVINLRKAIGFKSIPADSTCNLVITEYNLTVQAFLVGEVDHIVNMTWDNIMPPPNTVGRHHFLTALTKIKRDDFEHLVEIIDVEKVLADIIAYKAGISEGVVDQDILPNFAGRKILHADDSPTARSQVANTLSQLGLEIIPVCNGLEAFELLKDMVSKKQNIYDEFLMLITDAEMPVMDGYKLTDEIRKDPTLKDLYVVLNTSLSGSFNQAMVKKVGCDEFISKFQPDLLVKLVQKRLKSILLK